MATVRTVLKSRLVDFFFEIGVNLSEEKLDELLDLVFSSIGIRETEQNEPW
jgi:hypothetical protein